MKISAPEIEERLRNELHLRVEVKEAGPGLLVSGRVPSGQDRELAVEFVRSLAEDVPVADTIDIDPDDSVVAAQAGDRGAPPTADEALETGIRELLKLDPITAGLVVEVQVEQAIVELTGVVEDHGDAEYIEAIAGAVPGVRGVETKLTIGGIVHGEGEHRPGEPSATVAVPVDGGQETRHPAPGEPDVVLTAPTDEVAGGGRPYGTADIAYVLERAEPKTWGDLLDWLAGQEADERMPPSMVREMLVDFAALQTVGSDLPLDADALFDAAMATHVRGSDDRDQGGRPEAATAPLEAGRHPRASVS